MGPSGWFIEDHPDGNDYYIYRELYGRANGLVKLNNTRIISVDNSRWLRVYPSPDKLALAIVTGTGVRLFDFANPVKDIAPISLHNYYDVDYWLDNNTVKLDRYEDYRQSDGARIRDLPEDLADEAYDTQDYISRIETKDVKIRG